VIFGNLLEVFTVRLSFLVRLAAVPFVAFFLSACSKEGEAVDPKIRDKAEEVKKKPVNQPGEKEEKGGAAPVPD
jgi:hypothetical protein